MRGLTLVDIDYLAQALVIGLGTTPLRRLRENPPHGWSCDAWIVVDGLHDRAGRSDVVRTSRELRWEGDSPRLITAYPRA